MNKNLFKIGAIVMMIAFLSGFASGVATVNGIPQPSESNGVASITTNNATISVTGGNNVPFYHIQSKGTNTSYEVKFVNMQEFTDKNNDSLFQNSELVPQSTTLFPGANWNFSGFNTVNDSNNNSQMVNFNFTHATAPQISLDNHINVTAGNQIKFDLALANYTWKSTNTSTKLAIEMQIAGGNLSSTSQNQLTFGNGYFNTVSQAQTPNGNVSVTTQIANGNTFYLLFNHFNGNFSLDPVFGVQSTSSTSSTSTSSSSTSSTSTASNSVSSSTSVASTSSKTTPLALLPVLGSFAVVGIVVMKKRKTT